MKDVYDVFGHGVKLISCANDWMSNVSSLGDEHKDWLRDNTVYVYVEKNEPMFLRPSPEPAVGPAREPPASASSRASGRAREPPASAPSSALDALLARGAA